MNNIHLNSEYLKGFIYALIEEYQQGTPFYHLIHDIEVFIQFKSHEIAGIEICFDVIGDNENCKETLELKGGQLISEARNLVYSTLEEIEKTIKRKSK